MTIEPAFKKMLRDQPWDFKTKNEYEEVTLRQQPYVHMHYRNKFLMNVIMTFMIHAILD